MRTGAATSILRTTAKPAPRRDPPQRRGLPLVPGDPCSSLRTAYSGPPYGQLVTTAILAFSDDQYPTHYLRPAA
jgi:hypothetical protein